MDRLVVVVVEPTYLRNEETGRFAARIEQLGLTAYASSRDEASDKIRRMFASAVKVRRARGTLVGWLDRSELEWRWIDEYDGDMPIEYADASDGQRQSFRMGRETKSRQSTSNRWLPNDLMSVAA